MSELWRYFRRRRRCPTSMSSPRREWWSFLCSRRCSVSPLMRSVRSATWTSVEPVSRSSCRRSGSRRRNASSSTQFPSPLDVGPHLLDERLGGGEASLPAQAREKGDADGPAVQVALEVDHVRLHEDPASGLEVRAHADVDSRGATVERRRVHAVAGNDDSVVGDYVGRRHAEL